MGEHEEIRTADGRRITPERRTTLSEAQAWLAPSFRTPLTAPHTADLDWWPVLRIELLNLARRWLDAESSLADCGPGATVRTARPGWWRAAAATHEGRVHAPVSARLGQLRHSGTRNTVLKDLGLDLRVRRLATRSVPERGPVHPVGTMFVCEIPTPSMTDSLLATATSSDVVVSADPRCQRAAMDAGVPAVPMWQGRGAGPRPRLETLAGVLRRHLTTTDPDFARLAALPTARLWRSLMNHREHLRARVRELAPQAVATASDQHRYGVLATWTAREHAIPSVVFQHGIIADPVGFLPPRADWFLTIDEASSQLYEDAGARPERVVTVGRPRRGRRHRTTPGTYVVVPTQPLSTRATDELLALVARLEAPVLLRLHPGDAVAHSLSDEEYLARIGWTGPRSVHVDRSPGPDRALDDAALVVTHDSTFALDAVQAGVAGAAYSPEHAPSPLATTLPTFTEAEGLAKLWTGTLDGSAGSGAVGTGGEDAVTAARAVLESLR